MATPKILLLLFICLSSIFYCNAGVGSFTVGADFGPGFDGLYNGGYYAYHFNNSQDPYSIIGKHISPSVNAGFNFRYNFPQIVSIGAGIYYNRLQVAGFTIIDDLYSSTFYNPSYLTIPLLTRLSFGKKVIFFAEVGAYISRLTKSPQFYYGAGPAQFVPNATQFMPWDAGLTAGAGFQVPLPHRFALSFEALSNLGLLNINQSLKTYNCVLLCGFNYTLPTKQAKTKTSKNKTLYS